MSTDDIKATFVIPKTYKALVYDNPGTISTKLVELETPEPGLGEVLIRLSAVRFTSESISESLNLYQEANTESHRTHSGVCSSDLGVMRNGWSGLPVPTPVGQVGGHEGIGVVHKLGPTLTNSPIKVGDRVGIKWIASCCGTCPPCLEGADGVCYHQKVSGYFTPGTFQQYVLGPASYVTPIPDTLASADAAPMLCAGLTVYSALRKSLAKSGQWVVISGAGGGLGHMACQIASRGMAFRVLGIDHGSKESLVKECGAEEFLDVAKFDDDSLKNEVRRITGGRGASAAIVCAASNRSYAQALSFLKFHGTLVCVGMPEGRNEAIGGAFPSQMVLDEIRIVGSAVGGRREALEVLELAARGIVKTHYRLEKMENLNDVFQEMAEGRLQGRVVLDLA